MRPPYRLLAALVLTSPAFSGELEVREVKSAVLDQTLKVNVLLPDGYKEEADKRYPAVYLLHGYGGDYREWERFGVVEESAKLPVIIVMPEGDKSFYVNHHEDSKGRWEDYITKEVVEFADKTYRTIAVREARAISGLSMGGYGALVLGLRHPELFASAASHSGALGVPSAAIGGEIGDRIRKIYGPDDSKLRKEYDLFQLSKALPAESRPHIYIDCGSSDFLLDSNRKLVAHLSSLGIEYEYREAPGAHTGKYWKENVRYSLTRQLRALEAAQKSPRKPLAAAAGPGSPELEGSWDMLTNMDFQGNPVTVDHELRFSRAGGALKAVLISPRSGEHKFQSVTYKDGLLQLEIERNLEGNQVTFQYEGKLEGGKLAGKVKVKDLSDFAGDWKAERKAGKEAEKKTEKEEPPK